MGVEGPWLRQQGLSFHEGIGPHLHDARYRANKQTSIGLSSPAAFPSMFAPCVECSLGVQPEAVQVIRKASVVPPPLPMKRGKQTEKDALTIQCQIGSTRPPEMQTDHRPGRLTMSCTNKQTSPGSASPASTTNAPSNRDVLIPTQCHHPI